MKRYENFRVASREVVRELGFFKAYYGDTEVTSAQAHLLLELAQSAPLNLKEIIEKVQMDKSSASRTVGRLLEKKWVKQVAHKGDGRQKFFDLTKKGHLQVHAVDRIANQAIIRVFENLSSSEEQEVLNGIKAYAKALRRTRLQEEYTVRPLRRKDNQMIAEIIFAVLETEYQETEEEVLEMLPECQDLYSYYQTKGSSYWVIEYKGEILGGAGIAPFNEVPGRYCELQKMYFSPEIRGKGLGNLLIKRCLTFAKKKYDACYLDTRSSMKAAKGLYEKYEFVEQDKALGSTGHYICDNYYRLDLTHLKAG